MVPTRRLLAGIALVALVSILQPLQAVAATQPSSTQLSASGSVAITPAIQSKAIGSTATTAQFSVQLFNQSTQPQTFALKAADFTSLNQTGGVSFLDADPNRSSQGHGLSDDLKIDKPQVTVAPTSAVTITATVTDVSKLAPGGHYAAILAQVLPDNSAANGNRITANQVVASLLFLETAGQGTKNISLLSPAISNVSFGLPTNLNLVFKATGNTQTVPRGVVTISHGKKTVLQGIINDDSSLLLPGSTRLLPVTLKGDRHPVWPGMYKVTVQYRYDGSLGITTYQKSILYINAPGIVVVLLITTLLLVIGVRARRFWARRQGIVLEPQNSVSNRVMIVVRNRSAAAHTIVVKRRSKKPRKPRRIQL